VSFRRLGVAALAIAAALLPTLAAAARLDEAERQAATLDDRLAAVEKTYGRPDEPEALRAQRKLAEGEAQLRLGDFLHAAVLLSDAVESSELRATADYPRALALYGDALRRQGAYGAALRQYDEVLKLAASPSRTAALTGALECRVKLRRYDGVEALVDEARRTPGGVPPEVAYLAAKALYQRTDLAPAERVARVTEAFAVVPAPFDLAAAYFQGVVQVEANDLARAAERFERCTALPGKEPRQAEVRELCYLALGRVYGEQGKWAESLDRYQAIPRGSPNFDQSLYEVAWNFVRAKQYEQALDTARTIADLAPESQVAPEATILAGHLNLRLGHYAAASEAFNKVINTYAPVRDEIDAVLAMREDPVAYFDALIGQPGRSFEVTSVLPPIAVKWATAQRDVGGALDLVAALESGRRDLEEANAVAVRLEATLQRSGGLDAAPLQKAGWLSADALETAAVLLEGEAVAAPVAAAAKVLAPERRAELEQLEQRRLAFRARLEALPTTPAGVEARLARLRRRVDEVDQGAFKLGYQIDGAGAAITGTEAWIEKHHAEIAGLDAGRAELEDELQRHRGILAGYLRELRDLRRDIAAARDAAGAVEGAPGDASVRRAYLDLLAQERTLLAAARPALPVADAGELQRVEALVTRLDGVDERAQAVKDRLAGGSKARADGLRAQVGAARDALGQEQTGLDAVAGDAAEVLGRVAFRSFSAVRSQFYKLVLKADVGIVDVAWSRKRERLEKIQTLSAQKANELETLDREFKLVLREVE
jgi:tetratricopeptide (TPR) repeat protein